MKTRVFTARITPAERAALAKLAEIHNLTPAGWMRTVIRQSAAAHNLPAKLLKQLQDESLLSQLRQLGHQCQEKAAGS